LVFLDLRSLHFEYSGHHVQRNYLDGRKSKMVSCHNNINNKALAVDEVPSKEASDESLDEVVEIIRSSEQLSNIMRTYKDKIIIIKFFAQWCRACKAIDPKYKKVAKEFPNIKFCEIEFEANKELCRQLGISVLPSLQFYQGGETKVEDFSCGPKNWHKALKKILEYQSGKVSYSEN